MAATVVDNVKINVLSTGTGALQLGSAVDGYRGQEALTNGQIYNYAIRTNGIYEIGQGTYLSASSTLSRSVQYSSNGNDLVTLPPNCEVSFVALAADLNGTGLSAQAIAAAEQAIEASAQAQDALATVDSLVTPISGVFSTAGASLVGTESGLSVEEALSDRARYVDLAATGGADLVGFDPATAASPGTTAAFLQQLNQPNTSEFYAEDDARIQRLRDRVFIAGAADHNGTNSGPQPDWLTTYLISKGRTFGFQHVAQFAVLAKGNTAGQNAIIGAARSSELTAIGNVIGVIGIGVNDNTSYGTGAWGGYFEGFQNAGASGPCYGSEFDTINFGSSGSITPYTQAPNQVVALQVASGAEFIGTNAAHAVMNVRNNGARFDAGIVFGNDSLVGTDGGGTGTAIAMRMARGHGLQWMSSSSVVTTQIFSTSATAAGSHTVGFGEGATTVLNSSSGKPQFSIVNSGSSTVNYIAVQASATGLPAQIKALGDDTNCGIQLVPKGNSRVGIPLANVPNYSNDTAASAGGVSVGEIYRNGSVLMLRAA